MTTAKAGEWKIGKKVEMNNSLQIATYRQIIGKEQKLARGKTLKELEAMKELLFQKNTYMNYYKSPRKVAQEKKDDENAQYIYDQVMADKSAKMYN